MNDIVLSYGAYGFRAIRRAVTVYDNHTGYSEHGDHQAGYQPSSCGVLVLTMRHPVTPDLIDSLVQ